MIQSCIEKYSSIEVNLDPVENECGPYPKFKHIMSFLKIKNPSKRDKFVPEYIKTKNKIQNDFRSEPLGEQLMYEDFGKIFKPITEQQQKSSEEIVSKFAPLQEAIENMPAASITLGARTGRTTSFRIGNTAREKIQLPINISPIGRKNLNKYLNNEGDTTFGFKYNNKDDEYYLGNTRVDIKRDALEISGKRYPGTPGLEFVDRKGKVSAWFSNRKRQGKL